jgi:hypothetical protein
MDPVTAALNLANGIIALASKFVDKIWDALPQDQKAIAASDISKSIHNSSVFLQSIQEKINAAVGVK